ncbi:uncharacterized protein LOC122628661 isoform X1 [Vespula pensylvanica]|uniref:Uncharacterized protein n=1 Tax=Vespula pensylvanica TaxID=30213 RepID=A0A834P5Q3_VESPE|nr:uncharacterized protein LOC122628661 isoform X1 [Vespula pensylvanica]KAF7429468.1 hypothetical protein H0235_005866 [Vespula pensylvanica]
MLFCTFVRTAFSASLGAVVQIVILVLQSSTTSRVQATLPPGAEDEIILIEHLPGRRVHLQDFFWTGIDDAPPWVDPNQGLTFYETRTVHHTVTIYSPNDYDDKSASAPAPPHGSTPQGPGCTTCINPTPRLDEDEDQDIGILIGEDPGPRYWLLTVLRAGESIPQKVELKLARLYRTAFSRQQQRHLGLLSTDPRARRATEQRGFHERMTTGTILQKSSKENATIPTESSIELKEERMIDVSKRGRKFFGKFRNNDSEILDNVFNKNQTHEDLNLGDNEKSSKKVESNLNYLGLKKLRLRSLNKQEDDDDIMLTNSSSMIFKDQHPLNFSSRSPVDWKRTEESNKDINLTGRSKLRSLDGVVQIKMHNTSIIEGEGTRLIYSVHLDGKPVPAETAARDMALLSSQEVALELGVPVIIRSEPYLKETRPLALSRKRDVWLLVGAAGAAVILLVLLLTGLVLIAKRKRAHSAVVPPPNKSILKKERDYVLPSSGLDNTAFLTPDSEGKIEGTSQRQTPGTLSRTPDTTDSLHRSVDEFSTDNEEESKKLAAASPWSIEEQPSRKTRVTQGRMTRTNAIDPPRTPDSMDTIADHAEMLESLENGYPRQEEVPVSPRSYLSMPSCKQFPSMRSVEPLSRVLEPVTVKHLDVDSPESGRRKDNGYVAHQRSEKMDETFLTRAASASRDPGVVGPIVWTLKRQGLSTEGNGTSEISDVEQIFVGSGGPVGRARRRLHELLEDSFSLFGSREPKSREFQTSNTRPNSAVRTTDALTIFTEGRHSPTSTPPAELSTRPRTSASRRNLPEDIPETGQSSHTRGTWGSRPLSAGPFHKPNLPEVDTRRILADSQLSPEDPAVPLISSIKKELEKFSPR